MKRYFVSYTGFYEQGNRDFGSLECSVSKKISGMNSLLEILTQIRKSNPRMIPETISVLYWKRFKV